MKKKVESNHIKIKESLFTAVLCLCISLIQMDLYSSLIFGQSCKMSLYNPFFHLIYIKKKESFFHKAKFLNLTKSQTLNMDWTYLLDKD